MAHSQSALLPRDFNLNTPTTIERKTSYIVAESHNYSAYQDRENIQIDELSHGFGSAFDNDVTVSPIKISSRPDMSVKRSKMRSPSKSPRKEVVSRKGSVEHAITPLTEEALRENEGLTKAIQILEDDRNESTDHNAENDTASTIEPHQGYPGMDETDFTTFSAVPNTDMTLFAQLGHSPTKTISSSPTKFSNQPRYPDNEAATPQKIGSSTPVSATTRHFDDGSPSPTPRRKQKNSEDDTTNLILDFTEQFNAFSQSSNRSPSRSGRLSPKKSQTQPDLASYISGRRTPSPNKRPTTPSGPRHYANLLDFDLPPAPTPRSIPSITARELESLKSSFLSQISSLRATLSGKEAEVNSLKDAVGDAERRVGEALEKIREESGTKESLQAEKLDWERRDKEMQTVLRNVKEVNIQADRERDNLQQKFDESDRKREEAEAKLIEAQSKIAGLESGSSFLASENGNETPMQTNANGNVEAAVEKVAKELHSLYRQKHEAKVSALKDSYRARWERKVHELESKIEDFSRKNEELRLGRDATMSGVLPGTLPVGQNSDGHAHPHHQDRAAEDQRFQEIQAKLASVEDELSNTKHRNDSLLIQLEKERLEMADLVAATEEMMQLSLHAPSSSVVAAVDIRHAASNSGSGSPKASTFRAPGLGPKPPGLGTGESRIGRMGGVGKGGVGLSGGSGGVGVVGGGPRSGIMGNIERMGRGRAGDL